MSGNGAAVNIAGMRIGRLAPTPSGSLHLGNARTFLIAWLSARAAGGRVVLRIDDLDQARVKPGAVDQALADLQWLGLEWDGAPLLQSHRGAAYAAALEKLRTAGLVYPCTCSRREIDLAAHAPHLGDEGPIYSGTCRARARDTGRLPAWRMAVQPGLVDFTDGLQGYCQINVAATGGDFVVFRNDGIAAYQLATVVDDAFQGVTEVVRGDDLLSSTPRQLLLYRALGLTPPQFLHVPLVLDAGGDRMAKRRDSTRLAALRAGGVPAARVIGQLAASCRWAEPGEEVLPAELIQRFDLAKLPRHPVQLDDR